jgi:hypothetical protein
VRKDLRKIVEYSRKIGAAGFAFFRYGDIKNLHLENIIEDK